MKPVKIRALEEPDVEETVRMWRRSREGVQPELEERLGYSPSDDLRFFTSVLQNECEIFLAVDSAGERPVGFLAIKGDSIEQLYIDPIEQKQGIGTSLMDFAKSRSADRLELHTHQTNAGARRFYEKSGFRAIEFGVSGPPESEPDIRYEWKGRSGSTTIDP
jgi:ribosomal protein S18 acetylase RimI-like enzyme